MDVELSPADLAFREEVRAFLAAELPDDIRDRWHHSTLIFPDRDDGARWHRILAKRGWIAPNWPQEHGGPGWNIVQKFIFDTECNLAGAPPVIPLGLRMVAPVLMRYGTDGQKRRFLPAILDGSDYWCQGYSEPGSGSDLASLRTRAEADGDDYVVNGSKIWTTHAQFADWMFCLVRTSQEKRRQDGITFLLIDMRTPGITIRPIITLAGHHEVNQVFFDNVRVPQANRVGEEGQGWTVAKYLLEFERGGSFYTGRTTASLTRLRRAAAAGGMDGDPDFMRRVASLAVEAEALAATELRVLSALSTGQNPGPAASMMKAVGSELTQEITELTVAAAGWYACPFDELEGSLGNEPPVAGEDTAGAAGRYFTYRAASIFGGTNQVQRDIIAKQVLRL